MTESASPGTGDGGTRPTSVRWLGADWRYLLRELGIVFVGVLIALAVNDWSMRREETARQRDYLVRLIEELAADSAELEDFFLPGLEAKLAALTAIRPYVSGQDTAVRDTLAMFRNASMAGRFGIGTLTFRRVTFEDMQSTGSLRLIRDPEIRGEIVQHYNDSDRMVNLLAARVSGYGIYFVRLVPGELFRDTVTLDTLRPFDLGRALGRLRSEEVHDLVIQETNYALFMRWQLRELASRTNRLLRKLHIVTGTG